MFSSRPIRLWRRSNFEIFRSRSASLVTPPALLRLTFRVVEKINDILNRPKPLRCASRLAISHRAPGVKRSARTRALKHAKFFSEEGSMRRMVNYTLITGGDKTGSTRSTCCMNLARLQGSHSAISARRAELAENFNSSQIRDSI
jgi:hypothetical protein